MNGIVAIVGRPNVGKSTLFNRLIEKKDAIVDSESGVTRDRNYGKCDWNGKEFSIIDTGGYLVGGNDIFEKQIDKQVELAIDECDLIIFLVDVESGLIGMDQEVSKLLYKSKKPFFLAVNKVDNSYRQNQIHEFYQIGVDKIYPISAINGSGTGDLLDDVVVKLPTIQNENQQNLPKFAVVGRPNAGKSSYINSLIGETRYIVTDIPGTTRDSIDTKYNLYGFEFILIDTAGIRKKSKVKENIEFYSVMRSIRSIERSDVCFLIFDATREFDSQVQNIFWLAEKNNKGIVILVNKWDLVKKSTRTIDDFINKIKKRIEPFDDVPIIFISSINKQRIHKAIEKGIHVFKNRVKKIITRDLNTDLLEVINNTPPPSIKGKSINIKFCTQLPGPYPQFAFFCNLPQYIKENYRRFLENRIRDIYDFQGCPINIYFRKK
tara:strand:+ start:1048 stop:2352 length:1305 start_codon:yes stop_codon:yes gene_type:complete